MLFGTDLRCCFFHVSDAGHNAQHGAALERQAVGRSVRVGQDKPVVVTRFIVQGTIEAELFNKNKAAIDKLNSANAADQDYICESLDEHAQSDDDSDGAGGAFAPSTSQGGSQRASAASSQSRAKWGIANQPMKRCVGKACWHRNLGTCVWYQPRAPSRLVQI